MQCIWQSYVLIVTGTTTFSILTPHGIYSLGIEQVFMALQSRCNSCCHGSSGRRQPNQESDRAGQ